MRYKTIDKMTNEKFENILDQIGENDPDMIALPDFMETLWALCAKDTLNVVELTAKLVGDHIEIAAPQGVAVHGNEIVLGNHRIVLKWTNN